MDGDLKRVLNYLNKERGFDFSGYRPSMVERRMEKRLTPTKCADVSEYLEYLKQHPHELDNLVDVLTINVSRFFRNTLAFDYMADKILPAVVFDKLSGQDPSLRIWSAGCATGEEPYSIAILIQELQRKERLNLSVNIFATDDVLTMISEYLSLEGYNVLTATSGTKALRLAREHRPFAITLDVIMPEMDGWEVLQHLKKDPDTKDIPVIIVSVSDDKQTGFALGAVGYITKPVNRDLLISEIHRIDGSAPHTIMVVDDNEIERKEMAGMIEEEGMKALVAEDGRRCMDMIQESLPDVLVLDLIMPEVDGFEVARRIKSERGDRHIPVIALTAHAMKGDREKTFEAGCDDYVSKPVDPEKLLETIESYLRK